MLRSVILACWLLICVDITYEHFHLECLLCCFFVLFCFVSLISLSNSLVRLDFYVMHIEGLNSLSVVLCAPWLCSITVFA